MLPPSYALSPHKIFYKISQLTTPQNLKEPVHIAPFQTAQKIVDLLSHFQLNAIYIFWVLHGNYKPPPYSNQKEVDYLYKKKSYIKKEKWNKRTQERKEKEKGVVRINFKASSCFISGDCHSWLSD